MITGVPHGQNEKRQRTAGGFSRREVLLTGTSAAAAVLLGGSNPAMSSGLATPIYAIRQNGDMVFYKHDGADDGSPGFPVHAAPLGHGWDFRHVFASR